MIGLGLSPAKAPRRKVRIGALLCAAVCLLSIAGCAALMTSKTEVEVEYLADGTCRARYRSDKEQQGITAAVCGGSLTVDKSGTLESVVAATAQTQAAIARIIEQLAAAAKAGALAGS